MVWGVEVGASGRDLPGGADQRDALVSASPSEQSSAGDCAASASALGESRIPDTGQRRPSRLISRRWISAARPNSISCSHTAHASASNASGLPHGRSCGLART